MEKGTGHSTTQPQSHCCNVAENQVPATQSPELQSFDIQAVPVVALFVAPSQSLVDTFVTHDFASSPPRDVQSLFCTLLI
jgi:hypothetical protein